MTQDKLQESPFDDLMYRAGLTADGSFFDMDAYDQEAVMKFAHLIVKECADIACKHMELNEGTDFNIGDKFKEHFGVE